MRPLTFSMPFLPPSLNVYRNEHWRKQREEGKTWKDFIAVKWAELGRPKLEAVRITVVFSFPDRKTRDLDNYLATGSKLVGDAVKGRFIPDDSPEHLTAWSFRFKFGNEAKTTIMIEVVGRGGAGDQATLWEDLPGRSKNAAAGAGDDAKRSAGEQVSTRRLSGRQAVQVETATGCPFRGNSCHRCPSDGSPAGRASAGPSSNTRPDCGLYETCIAPLCPLDRNSLKGVWYPDEEICRSRTQGNLSWLKAQKKIAGCGAGAGRYFTLSMLNRNCIIRRGITGLDPNEPEEAQLKKWLDEHPVKREMSEDEILMRKRLAQKCLVRRGNKAPSEGVSTPFSKPPLNRGKGRKKCP